MRVGERKRAKYTLIITVYGERVKRTKYTLIMLLQFGGQADKVRLYEGRGEKEDKINFNN